MNRISSHIPSLSPVSTRVTPPQQSCSTSAAEPSPPRQNAAVELTIAPPEIPRAEPNSACVETKPQATPVDPCAPLFLEDVSLDKDDSEKVETFGSFLSNFRHYTLRGVPKPTAFSPELRALWNEKFLLSPHEFFSQLFNTPKVKLGSGEICVEGGLADPHSVSVSMDLVQPRRGTIGRMDREFRFPPDSPPEVHHNLFEIDSSAQGHGIAKDLLANSMQLYDQAGIGRIHLTAGLDVGGYAWAKYGFLPKDGQATRELFSRLNQKLDGLRGISVPTREVVRLLLKSGDPKALWTISDLDGVTAERRGEQLPLGKALLLGTCWKGVMNLDDPQARKRFHNYISRSTSQNTEEKR